MKIRKLEECVAAAESRDLPVNIGTELNKYGQLWIDDFSSEVMQKLAPVFIKGAEIMVGHTRLLRWADLSYTDAAASELGTVEDKNDFFAQVGRLDPGTLDPQRLKKNSSDDNLQYFKTLI